MKKIKITFTICLLILAAISKGQIMKASGDDLATFFASTVNVPITGNVAFDEALQNGFSKYWKITPFKFVEGKEYKKMYKENDELSKHVFGKPKSFLFSWGHNQVEITDIISAETYSYGDENLLTAKWVDGTDFFAKSKTFDNIKYRIEYIIKAMNDLITITRDHNLTVNAFTDYSLVINSKAKSIKDKTLIVNKDLTYGNKTVYKEDVFAKNYPYPYKFVTDAEFKEILKGEKKEYVCLVPVYWQGYTHMQALIFVYEPSTRNSIYMDFCETFNKFDKNNIDQLKKGIGN